jgi:hypothetical protein
MDVDEFGKDSGLLLPLEMVVVASFFLEGDMVSSGFNEEVGKLFLCWLPLLL